MTSQATQTVKKPRRRWWWFLAASVSVLILVTIKWIGPIGMEQYAISKIRSDCPGVEVTTPDPGSSRRPVTIFSPALTFGDTMVETQSLGPEFARTWTGYELLRVDSIYGSLEELRPVASQLFWLRYVKEVSPDRMDDDSADLIRHFVRLETLSIGDVNLGLSDRGISQWGQLTKLRVLDLSGSRVRGGGFAALKDLDRLVALNLDDTPIHDSGLKYLAELESLEQLSLCNTKITDEGLEHLENCKRLKQLSLIRTEITDAGLIHLTRIESLEDLELSYSKITPAALLQLGKCPSLRRLRIRGFAPTDEELDRLAQALPNCRVLRF